MTPCPNCEAMKERLEKAESQLKLNGRAFTLALKIVERDKKDAEKPVARLTAALTLIANSVPKGNVDWEHEFYALRGHARISLQSAAPSKEIL